MVPDCVPPDTKPIIIGEGAAGAGIAAVGGGMAGIAAGGGIGCGGGGALPAASESEIGAGRDGNIAWGRAAGECCDVGLRRALDCEGANRWHLRTFLAFFDPTVRQ